MELAQAAVAAVAGAVRDHVNWLATPHPHDYHILLVNWAVQFVCSWIAFAIYMVWDYRNYKANRLEKEKLPSRHPLDPFWESQLRMVPLVLYNQCVVWPLVSLLLVWPQWALNERSATEWGWALIPSLLVLMVISDLMWYWGHRLMHTPYAWRNWHRMHHIAEQTAISATYVHPVEYTLFTVAMNLPYAMAGFPMWVHAIPMGWGMFTGSGAHSGYSGAFANGDKHQAHHNYHNVNFGLLMMTDQIFGTHWAPGDPAPVVWTEAVSIWKQYETVHGNEASSTFLPPPGSAAAVAAAAKRRVGADADVSEAEAAAQALYDLAAGKTARAAAAAEADAADGAATAAAAIAPSSETTSKGQAKRRKGGGSA